MTGSTLFSLSYASGRRPLPDGLLHFHIENATEKSGSREFTTNIHSFMAYYARSKLATTVLLELDRWYHENQRRVEKELAKDQQLQKTLGRLYYQKLVKEGQLKPVSAWLGIPHIQLNLNQVQYPRSLRYAILCNIFLVKSTSLHSHQPTTDMVQDASARLLELQRLLGPTNYLPADISAVFSNKSTTSALWTVFFETNPDSN
jgi:hypothetical protein